MLNNFNLKIIVLFLYILLLNACATKQFVRQEKGELLLANQSLKETPLPTKYDVSFKQTNIKSQEILEVIVIKYEVKKKEWNDIYSALNVYESSCEDWWTRLGRNSRNCEYKEPTQEELSKPQAVIIKTKTSIKTKNIKLTIGGISALAELTGDIAQFNFVTLKLKPDCLPRDAQVLLNIDTQLLNVSNEFKAFVENSEKIKIENFVQKMKIKNKYEEDKNEIYKSFPGVQLQEAASLGCEEFGYNSFLNSGWIITRKIDRNHYEAFQSSTGTHAIVITVRTEFTKVGSINDILLRYMGYAKMSLSNGFTSSVFFYKECAEPSSCTNLKRGD